MIESELDQLDAVDLEDEYICKPCNDDISATQPQEDVDTTVPPTVAAAVEDDNNAGIRRPRRQCKAKTMEKMSKNVQSDMQSEREALGHMLQDDEKELLDASDNYSRDDSSIIDEDALSDSSNDEDISYHEDESEEDVPSSSEDESDTDEPPPPPATTTRRPKRKEKAPPTPEPSRKKKKPPKQKPPPTTSTTRRTHKSDKPKCSEPKRKTPPPTTSTRQSDCNSGKCSVPGCTNKTEKISRTSYRKKCSRHRKKLCSFPGCDKHAQFKSANGRFCVNHGQSEAPEAYAEFRAKKKKPEPDHTSTPKPSKKKNGRKSDKPKCSEPGCERVVKARGLCEPHAYGRRIRNKSDKCSQSRCTNVATNRGLCRRHAYGTKKCSVDGCTRDVHRRDLCYPHAYGTKKCSVDGCTNNTSSGNKKCTRHLCSCSYPGCNKYGLIVPGNGSRFCGKHGRTQAPEAYAEFRRTRNRQVAERYHTDPQFRIALLIRQRLCHALRRAGTSYQGKLKLLGCSVNQFKRYLAQFFSESGNDWMSWLNQGRIEGVRCWEMDHIYPLSELNLTDPEVLRRAAHWSNFQPLSAAENQSLYNSIPDGFEWRDDLDRWWWSEDSGRTNYELPATGAEDVTIDDLFDDESDESSDDEFDGSEDDSN